MVNTTRRIAKEWKLFSNVNSSEKATILILWDPNILDIQQINLSSQQISCRVNSIDGRFSCVISSVYDYNNMQTRKDLWTELSLIHNSIGSIPWLICGDFNTELCSDEKLGGSDLTDGLMLIPMTLAYLLKILNSSHVEFMLPNFSDHSQLLSQFMMIVLKLKGALKSLNKRHFGNISEQVIRAKVELEDIQKKLQADPLNPAFINQERESIVLYNKLLDHELSFYQQKARTAWSIQGDRNSKLFHSAIKTNRHNNRILVLYNSQGARLTDGDEIAKEFISFYKNLMGTAVHTSKPEDLVIQ
ncbi:uncharacterized protein LOC109828581 [Asparagus officinalis]|uniref:uncharacterized protein LOC109828581 n=1 Tax=Asparagus officinalis TaxID=4686 RepID=UPI00098E2025|nr:uncharacterized protein LOC109828581 [Asparagus officinalis]